MLTGCHVNYAQYNDPSALRRKLKHGFFLNVFAIVFFEKMTADELTILHKNALYFEVFFEGLKKKLQP